MEMREKNIFQVLFHIYSKLDPDMWLISAVGLFCFDKFEETSNEKVVNMSKLTKPYF